MQQFDDICRPKSVLPGFDGHFMSSIAINISQSNNENTSSSKGARIQVPDDWRSSINISDGYAANRDDFIGILKPLESM